MIASRIEAEQAVLGAVLLSDSILEPLLTEHHLHPDHFYNPQHQAIWAAMAHLHDQGQPVDTLTLAAHLDGQIERAEIDLLAGSVPAVGNVHSYARIVLAEAWHEHVGRCLQRAYDANHARDREAVHAALADIDKAGHTQPAADNWEQLLDWYDGDTPAGIPLPFPTLTEAVGGGLQPGETTMLAGWPQMGKTLLSKDFMLHAVGVGARVHEYANETIGPRRTGRIIASVTGIPAGRIARRELRPDELQKVLSVSNNPPYRTTASSGWRVEDYCRELRRSKWDLAVIDTVTRIPARDTADWDRISGMLADTAAQTGTHLILLSQLNLARDTGAIRPAPTGRDLRNTGAWYQDARNVLFIHRDQELLQGTQIPRVLPEGHVRVDKATHGDGSDGFVQVCLSPTWLRFDAVGRADLREVS